MPKFRSLQYTLYYNSEYSLKTFEIWNRPTFISISANSFTFYSFFIGVNFVFLLVSSLWAFALPLSLFTQIKSDLDLKLKHK